MLCWFLPHINMNQSQAYICPLPLQPPSHLPAHPTPLGCPRARFEFPESYSKSPLAICFTYTSVSISMQLSPFAPPCPSPAVSTSRFSLSASPLLPCQQVPQYRLSRFSHLMLRCQSWSFCSCTSKCFFLQEGGHHLMVFVNSVVMKLQSVSSAFTQPHSPVTQLAFCMGELR